MAFYGFVVKAGSTHEAEIPENTVFSLCNVALNANDGQKAQIWVETDSSKYLLATLCSGKVDQQTLDLNFFFDEEAPTKFSVTGHGEVHLTGYLQLEDDDLDMDDFDEEDDENGFENAGEEVEGEDEEEEEEEKPQVKQAPKNAPPQQAQQQKNKNQGGNQNQGKPQGGQNQGKQGGNQNQGKQGGQNQNQQKRPQQNASPNDAQNKKQKTNTPGKQGK